MDSEVSLFLVDHVERTDADHA